MRQQRPQCLKLHPPLVAKMRITTAQDATASSESFIQLLFSTSYHSVNARRNSSFLVVLFSEAPKELIFDKKEYIF